jgi:hypothetical protein
MKEEANISERMDNCQQRGKKKGKARRAEDAPNRTLGARLTTRPERKPTKFFFFPSAFATRHLKPLTVQSQRSSVTCAPRFRGAKFDRLPYDHIWIVPRF